VQRYIQEKRPYVIALNTQNAVDEALIDVRAACHPIRLLADGEAYRFLPQPLVVPVSRLSESVRQALQPVPQKDFGMSVQPGVFEFGDKAAVVPTSLVVAYALALATSGRAARILLAGFDGYGSDDPRTVEMDQLLALYQSAPGALPLLAITPTRYKVPATSVYAL
jgi:4-hydroxy 2-oxovalerate aldolase